MLGNTADDGACESVSKLDVFCRLVTSLGKTISKEYKVVTRAL